MCTHTCACLHVCVHVCVCVCVYVCRCMSVCLYVSMRVCAKAQTVAQCRHVRQGNGSPGNCIRTEISFSQSLFIDCSHQQMKRRRKLRISRESFKYENDYLSCNCYQRLTTKLALWLRHPSSEQQIWGSIPACSVGIFPGVKGSALGLVCLVSVYCDWVR